LQNVESGKFSEMLYNMK